MIYLSYNNLGKYKLSEWLTHEKNISICSAKNVISRCGRVRRILNIDSIDNDTLENLQNNDAFKESSVFIKSQLKIALSLYFEF